MGLATVLVTVQVLLGTGIVQFSTTVQVTYYARSPLASGTVRRGRLRKPTAAPGRAGVENS